MPRVTPTPEVILISPASSRQPTQATPPQRERWHCCRCYNRSRSDRYSSIQECDRCGHDQCRVCFMLQREPAPNVQCWTCHKCGTRENIDNMVSAFPNCNNKKCRHGRCVKCHRNSLTTGQVSLHWRIESIQDHHDAAYLEIMLRENYEMGLAKAKGDPDGEKRAKICGRLSGASIVTGNSTNTMHGITTRPPSNPRTLALDQGYRWYCSQCQGSNVSNIDQCSRHRSPRCYHHTCYRKDSSEDHHIGRY